jgi:hypothetical protein
LFLVVSRFLPCRCNPPFEVEEDHDDVSFNEVDITIDGVEGLRNSDTESIDLIEGQGSGDENTVTDRDDEEEGDGGSTEEEICLNKIPMFEGEVTGDIEDEEQPASRYPVGQRYKPWAPRCILEFFTHSHRKSGDVQTDHGKTTCGDVGQATSDEMKPFREMGVYEKVDLPSGKAALPSKIVFTVKRDKQGNVV